MVGGVREILEALGYTKLSEYPKEFRAAPLHRESDNATALSIRKDSGKWIDYAAGATGDLYDLVQLTLRFSPEEAKAWLENRGAAFVISPQIAHTPTASCPEIFDKSALLRLTQDFSYWEERGISSTTLTNFQGGLAYKGKMAGRYVFPIFNSRQDVVGFAGRDIFNNGKRAKWKLLGAKEKWVYPAFLNAKDILNAKKVVLVESVGDCLALFNAGIRTVLVTFGLSLSSGILNFLIRSDVSQIVIGLNNDALSQEDAHGNRSSVNFSHKLGHYFDEHQIRIALPSAKDFGEMNKEQILLWNSKNELYLPVV